MNETDSKFSDSLIKEELARVCSSKELKPKYRLCSLLEYLVTEKLSGRRNRIKNYTIGINVFFRDKDFNPEIDPIVRIEMGRLRRSLDKYYSDEGKYDQVQFYIPMGKYTPVFKSKDSKQFHLNKKEKNEIYSASDSKPSIIILPFENLTNDPGYEYFVRGFTEELLIELTHYQNYRLIGYRVKDEDNTINGEKKIMEDLKANFSISGSIRRDEKQVKITIKLSDVSTDEQLWVEQFRFELNPANIILAQEEIAYKAITIIANEYGIISQKISKDSRGKTPQDLNTYEAILRYYYYQIHHTHDTAEPAFNALKQALANDPESGIVLAMLATMYGTRYLLDLPGNNEEVLKQTVELSNKALELEPNNQFVRISHAWSHFIMDEKDAFLTEMKTALNLNPRSPFQVGAIGFYLALYGKWNEGKILLDKAMNQNIGFPTWFYGATTIYFYRLKDYKNAYSEALKYSVKGVFWGPLLRAASLGQLGRTSEVEKDILDLIALRPDFETKARLLISRYVKEDKLVEHIIEGLKKAGLKISQ